MLDLASRDAPPAESDLPGAPDWLGLFLPSPESGASVAAPHEVVRQLAVVPPSDGTLQALLATDSGRLDAAARVDYLVAVDAHLAWLEGLRQAAVLAVAGTAPDGDDERREEVACAIRLSPATAQRRIDTARALSGFLPRTREHQAAGRLPGLHAAAVADAVSKALTTAGIDPLPPAGTPRAAEVTRVADAVEDAIYPLATRQTLADLRRTLARVLARALPHAHAEACAQAAATRSVQRFDADDGMITLVADLPAIDALTVWDALTAAARIDPRQDLGLGARRADALVAWATRAPAPGAAPSGQRPGGRPVSVQVRVDLPTLLGLTDQPGELVGYGPIPAPLARELAADHPWERLVTHPVTGHLLDYARTAYSPPAELRRYLRARDQHCIFPGCHRPASGCDTDHLRPFGRGGSTSAENCHTLCRRHHRLKTLHGWTYRIDDDGGATWIAPTGHAYPANKGDP